MYMYRHVHSYKSERLANFLWETLVEVRDTNIHKVLQIMHLASVKCDVKVRGWGSVSQ